jgi:endonuclease IV
MSPEVYMCYLISVKRGDFRQLTRVWKSEFRTYETAVHFNGMKNRMKDIRKKHRTSEWSNFNVEKLLDFISEHLYWGKDEEH